MKRNLLIILLAVFAIGFYSCDEDDSPDRTLTTTLSQGAGYTNDIYYSLANGVVAEVPRTNWDIAFSVDAMSSSILINDGAGVILKAYPADAGWEWVNAIDTAGYNEWDALYNSNESWEEGAFGQNAIEDDLINYGWGDYNMTTHDVEGVNQYIIKLVDGTYKRIFVEIKEWSSMEYKFIYSDLNGDNEVSKTISYADLTNNYIYYSIVNDVIVEREPDATTWDLLFTKYFDPSIPYIVAGVKQNIGVQAIELDNVLDLSVETYLEADFDDNITKIGSDWKDFDMGTNVWSIDADRIYFVKDQNDKVYKIVFTGFGGSATGDISFDITAL